MSDNELIAELGELEGWHVLVELIGEWRNANLRTLEESKTLELTDVARLQGENAAFRRLIAYVNNRRPD